jgi:hypothetical protein
MFTTAFARKPIRRMHCVGLRHMQSGLPQRRHNMPMHTPTKPTSCASTSIAAASPGSRGGRRNVPGGILDQIKFIRISMLTDPALDAGRHEFELRTLLGRILPPGDRILDF